MAHPDEPEARPIEVGGATPLALAPPSPGRVRPPSTESSAIHGVVLERGQPVAGAIITCIGRTFEREAHSDADGAFHFEGLAPGEVDVRALGPSAKTSRAVHLELSPGPQELRLELEAGCDLSVDVKDSEERLIPELQVYASRFASAEEMRRAEAMTAKAGPRSVYRLVTSFNQHEPRPPEGAFVTRALADAKGLALLRALPPGAYEISAVSISYGALPTYVELCPPSGTTQRTIRFPVGISIEGRVVDASGAAIAGADVHAYFAEQRGIQVPRMAKTGQGGRFVVPHVDAGQWRLDASAPGFPKSTAQVAVPAEGRRDLSLVLLPGRTIRGRVVDHRGEASAQVWRIWATASGRRNVMDGPNVLSDAAGRFELPTLERDGTYEVWATGKEDSFNQPRRSSARVQVGPGVTEVVLRLGAVGKVRGTVELARGGTSPSCQVVGTEPVSCADGTFALELEPGEQVLRAQADSYSVARVAVKVVPGEEVNVAIRLEPLVQLMVTVVDARTQRPLEGAGVRWHRAFPADADPAVVMEETGSFPAKSLTDAQGRSFQGAEPGASYSVSVVAPDYAAKSGAVGGSAGDEVVLALEGVMLVSGDVVVPAGLEQNMVVSGLAKDGGYGLGAIHDHHFSHPIASSEVGPYRLLVRVELSDHLGVMVSQPIDVPAGGLHDLRVVMPIGDASASFDLGGAVTSPGRRPEFVLRSLDRPELSYESAYHPRGPAQFRQGMLVPGNYILEVKRWGKTEIEKKVTLVAGQEAQIRLEK